MYSVLLEIVDANKVNTVSTQIITQLSSAMATFFITVMFSLSLSEQGILVYSPWDLIPWFSYKKMIF